MAYTDDLVGLMGGAGDSQDLKQQRLIELLRGVNTPRQQQVPMTPQQMEQAVPQAPPMQQQQPVQQQQQAPAQRQPMLRQAVAQYQSQPRPQMPQQQAPVDFDARAQELEQRRSQAEADYMKAMEPPDFAKAQEEYGRRQQGGVNAMLVSLAAQQAGQGFEPFAQHYREQAGEIAKPMKVSGGTLTPTGFIEDPGYKGEQRIKIAQARVAQADHALEFNLTQAERARMAKEALDAKRELQEAMLANQRAIAGIVHGGSKGEPGTWSQVGTDPQTNAPVFQNNKTMQLGTHDAQPVRTAKGFTGKGQGDKLLTPKTIDDFTESHGKATDIIRLNSEFKPAYAGLSGGLDYAVGQLPGVTNASAEWWRNYKKEAELIERHGLFGASLTPGETASWRSADINPTMDPQAIQRDLARREEILRNKYSNRMAAYKGYDTSALPTLEAPAAAPAAAAPGGQPVRVNSAAEAAKLPPGTPFIDHTGQPRVRK